MKRVLAFLSVNPEYAEFAIPQLKALLSPCPLPLETLLEQQLKDKPYQHWHQVNHKLFERYPLVVLKVPNFQEHRSFFQQVSRQSVMIHRMVLLISSGLNYQQLFENADQELLSQYCKNEQEKVVCDFNSRGRNIQREEQVEKIHSVLGKLGVKGHVDFKNPRIRYQLIERHQWYQKHHLQPTEKTLRQVFFGIQLGRNHIATAKFNYKYELRKRIYLGPTSTDNDLAFMMCNQALVKEGSFVFDPFVGTGSLLIPPASKKAHIFGSELDIRVLNGYSVGRINKNSPFYDPQKKYELFTPKINLNFQQYGFPIPNLIRIDSTKLALSAHQFFDAIITDPPYGIRAMSRTLKKQQIQYPLKEEQGQIVKQVQRQLVKQEQAQIGRQQNQALSDSSQGVSEETSELKKQLTEEQKRKKERKKKLRQNKKERKLMLSEEEKSYKRQLYDKMSKQRVEQWEKYDKGKVEFTERDDIFEALLNLARKYLRKEGRLVFLFPVYQNEVYKGAENLPPHGGFRLVDLSQNMMAKGNSRILVTLEKE